MKIELNEGAAFAVCCLSIAAMFMAFASCLKKSVPPPRPAIEQTK